MKIFEINSVPYGSTAKIMLGISEVGEQRGLDFQLSAGYSYHPIKELQGKYLHIGSRFGKLLHIWLTKFTGLHGTYSRLATQKLLKEIDRFQPDVLHFHNLHGWYVNFPTLFKYVKKHNIRVVWTLHDCWAFTGHCAHFDMIGCDRWQTGCFSCPQHTAYPKTYIDRSKSMYKRKKEWFTGIQGMTIVTPSNWLAELVKRSFLKDYPVKVINNGIDLSVFKPTDSDFRVKHGLQDKILLLGVAFGWGERKGLDVFLELAKRLDSRYQIVLVGTDSNVDKQLPENIISIHRTQNQTELAEIYSTADLFVNPTREENFPTVNIESLACGTPIVTFRTGGSPEIIDETCGEVVEKNDIDGMQEAIERICKERPYTATACIERAQKFDAKEKFLEYVDLYQAE